MGIISEYIALKLENFKDTRIVNTFEIILDGNKIIRRYNDGTFDILAHWNSNYECEIILIPRIARLKENFTPISVSENNGIGELFSQEAMV